MAMEWKLKLADFTATHGLPSFLFYFIFWNVHKATRFFFDFEALFEQCRKGSIKYAGTARL